MTRTNPIIDVNLVRRLISEQFPHWGDLPVEPVPQGGWDNRTFRLGGDLLIRMPSAQCYAAQVEIEQHWLRRLAPLLPLSIPTPVAMGEPIDLYPWRWSIYRWLPGETAAVAEIADENDLAGTLGDFLIALHMIDPEGGPPAGPSSFYRGGSLALFDRQAREAFSLLPEPFDKEEFASLWEAALASEWGGRPVWVHGDFAPRNLLVRNGELASVIDFGQLCVGDPACDLTIAWTFLRGAGRKIFRSRLRLDPATWLRARAWVIWKASILITSVEQGPAADIESAAIILKEVIEDYRNES